MRTALVLALLAGCSAFGTHRPDPRWRPYPGGPPPDCTVSSGPVVIDAVTALVATAVVVVRARSCGPRTETSDHDASCEIGRTVTMVTVTPAAIAYGLSALTGRGRNQACADARGAYHRANPGWPGT